MRILSTPGTTEVIDGAENIDRRTDEAFNEITEQLDDCFDQTYVAGLFTIEHRQKNLNDLAKRGVRIRHLTSITKDNIQYCKEILKIKGQELRHLDGAKGNFAIVDRTEYTNILVQEEGERPTQALVSNVRSFVQQQQYSFDALWQKAIPAQERIKEIEEGIRPDFIETIRDPIEIQKIGFGLVKSAMKDILILFSTPDSFRAYPKTS